MVAESKSEQVLATLKDYAPTPYVETVWPRIEENMQDKTFSPAAFEVISQPVRPRDEMFDDFAVEVTGTASPKTSDSSFEVESFSGAPDQDDDAQSREITGQRISDSGESTGGSSVAQDETTHGGEIHELEPSEGGENQNALAMQEHEFEAALAAARQEGYAAGVSETKQEVELVCAELRTHVSSIIEDFRAQSAELVQEHEHKAVELAMNVARRLVCTTVDTQREYVLTVIREAMQSVGGATITAIRVSPRDFEFMANSGGAEQLEGGAQLKNIFTSDDTVKAGCIIVTSSGEIDFDLDAAWSRLSAKLG